RWDNVGGVDICFFSKKGVKFFLLFTKFFPQCYKLPCYLEWIRK
ncbi:MAG: hypothetical protein ACI89T_001918, partial [Cognaticolwellia sp.]